MDLHVVHLLLLTLSLQTWIGHSPVTADDDDVVHFEISPNSGMESVTRNVSMKCRTKARVQQVVLIQITTGDDQSLAVKQPGKSIVYGRDGQDKKYQAEADIDNVAVKGGYLYLTYYFPLRENTGIYKCHMIIFDRDWVLRHVTAEMFLNVNKFKGQGLESKVVSLEKSLQKMNQSILELRSDMDSNNKTPLANAFSASLKEKLYGFKKHDVIVFDKVITKVGKGYDDKTGVFTAPVDGLFAFHLVIEIEGKKGGAGFALIGGHRELARLYVQDESYGDQSAVSSVVDLKKGDRVKVKVVYLSKNPSPLFYNNYSVFSGYLIRQL